MDKLVITIIDDGYNGIDNIRSKVECSLGNFPNSIKVDYKKSEVLYEDRQEFILINNGRTETFRTLEMALAWARDKVESCLDSPAQMCIKSGIATYIEGLYFDSFAEEKTIFKDLKFLFG